MMKSDKEGEFERCPYCKETFDEIGHEKGLLIVLKDWSDMHDRETLLHCWDCDRKFIIYYKFARVVELVEKDIKWDGVHE